MNATTPSADQIAQRLAERRRAALRQQKAQLHALAAADAWPQWAAAAARFPEQSARNQLLVVAQLPQATLVRSSQAWREVGRWPKRGSTALRLWQTRPVKDKDSRITGQREVLAPVFDVSQTDGEPVIRMPNPPPPAYGRAPRGMAAALAAAGADLGWNVRLRPVPTGAAPVLDDPARTIAADPAGDQLTHCTALLSALTTAIAADVEGSAEHHQAVAAAAAAVVLATYDLPAPTAVRPAREWRHDHELLLAALDAATGIAWRLNDTLAAHAVGTAAAVAGDAMPPPPKPPALACLDRTA